MSHGVLYNYQTSIVANGLMCLLCSLECRMSRLVGIGYFSISDLYKAGAGHADFN